VHPRHQLARTERLRDVVVGAQFQAEHPVDLVVVGGDEQHRRPVTAGPQPPTDLGAGHVRQPVVENDRDRAQPPHRGQRAGAGGLDAHPEPVAAQVQPFQVRDHGLVLDHEDETAPRGTVGHPPSVSRGAVGGELLSCRRPLPA